NLLWVNDAFLSITGYSKADIMGQYCRFMQGPATDLQTLEELRIALEQGLEFSAEILNYRQDGSSFWNDLTISPTHDEQGQLTHFVGITRDITERKEAEEKLHLAASVFTHAREGIMITAPDGTIELDPQRAGYLVKLNHNHRCGNTRPDPCSFKT
ncbi:MAG: PAS domain-containing protein, partial [Xanthomonadaceae bacterium]|nr:PAS domain-containing protein [Xanthomonadaceae bacterium]